MVSVRRVISDFCYDTFEIKVTPPMGVENKRYITCKVTICKIEAFEDLPLMFTFYSFLTHIIAIQCKYIARDIIFVLGNIWVSKAQMKKITKQTQRCSRIFPTINIKSINQNNISDTEFSNVELVNYYPYEEIYDSEQNNKPTSNTPNDPMDI